MFPNFSAAPLPLVGTRAGRCISILLLGAAVALMTGRACGAVSADPLDLAETVERALAAAPELTSQRAILDSARVLVRSAGQLPDPELSFGIDDVPVTGTDAGSLSADDFTMRKVGIEQEMPRRAKRDLRTRLARDRVRTSEAEQGSLQLSIASQAAQSWIDVYFADQTVRRLQALEPELELQVRLATAAMESARSNAGPALAAQAAVFDFEDRLLLAQQELQRARIALRRWLLDAADRPLGQPPQFTELRTRPEELIASVHEHASVLLYEAQLDAARTEIELAKAEKRPDWSVAIDYGRREPAFADLLSVQFRISLPLWAGQRQDPVIASKYAALRQVESEREAELRMHRAEVTQRVTEWQSLQERIARYEKVLMPLARSRVQATQAGYEAGRQDIQPLLEARVAAVDVQLRCLELQWQLARAWAYLNYQRPVPGAP